MSRRRVAAAAALALVALLSGGGRAAAEAVSAAELRGLADAAGRSESARERLRRVDAVEGRPIAVGVIVEGARPDEIAPRVALALESAARSDEAAGGGAAARDRARALLRDRRFTGTRVPRPFTGALRWLSERLAPVDRLVDRVAAAIPGGPAVVYGALGLLVLGAAIVLSRLVIRRGAGCSGATGRGRARRAQDPRALEREAAAAERAGEYEAAVRLRMRAGLLRLDAGEVIAYRPSLTTGEVGRALGSPAFDALGRDFDAIAYGGREAHAADAQAARTGWEAVLAERCAA